MKSLPKIIVIVGPTSSGKSDLAVLLAKKYNGEIISADSRQVYKGMDIGSGKITKSEMGDISHHLLSIAEPKRTYNINRFKRDATKAIKAILKREKLPILCGGTGFYIQSIVDDIVLPEVKPNIELRKKLETKNTTQLFEQLKTLDRKRAKSIDKNNPRRLVRAIEIAMELGSVPLINKNKSKAYNILQIGIETSDDILKKRILLRLTKRLNSGMLAEGKNLNKEGLSWKRMEGFGLEYRFMAQHLTGKITKQEMIEKINSESWKYAKRQKTWFKRNKKIHLVKMNEIKKIHLLIDVFLKN